MTTKWKFTDIDTVFTTPNQNLEAQIAHAARCFNLDTYTIEYLDKPKTTIKDDKSTTPVAIIEPIIETIDSTDDSTSNLSFDIESNLSEDSDDLGDTPIIQKKKGKSK